MDWLPISFATALIFNSNEHEYIQEIDINNELCPKVGDGLIRRRFELA